MKWGENELKFQRRERQCVSSASPLSPPPSPHTPTTLLPCTSSFHYLQFCISLYADPSNRRPIFPLKKQTDMKNYLILPLIHLPLFLSCLHSCSPVSPSIQPPTSPLYSIFSQYSVWTLKTRTHELFSVKTKTKKNPCACVEGCSPSWWLLGDVCVLYCSDGSRCIV